MLVLMGAFLGVLIGLWYSFFQLLAEDGYAARSLAQAAAMQLGSLLVVGPAAYWMYARVTGQEGQQPELYRKQSRTVFLSIWMLVAVLSLVSIVISMVGGLMSAMFGFSNDAGDTFMSTVLPGLFAAGTIGFGIFAIVKHASRKFVMMAAMVLAGLAALLLVANLVMVLVRKDVELPGSTTSDCTYSKYMDRECTYSEYRDNLRDSTRDSLTPKTNRNTTGLESFLNSVD